MRNTLPENNFKLLFIVGFCLFASLTACGRIEFESISNTDDTTDTINDDSDSGEYIDTVPNSSDSTTDDSSTDSENDTSETRSTDSNTDTYADSDTDTNDNIDSGSDTDTDANTDANTDSDSYSDADTGTETGTGTGTGTATDSDSNPYSDTDTDTDTATDSDSEPQIDTDVAEYYVAPNGNDAGAGTLADPFQTMAMAQSVAEPGDTVYFRGGTYFHTSSVDAVGETLDKSGTPGNPIRYFAYGDERPAFYFAGMAASDRLTGFLVSADWIHIRGLELSGVPQTVGGDASFGIRVLNGNNNIFEDLVIHDNDGTGLSIDSGSDNLVQNCDSYDNYDVSNAGQNADGFGCHTSGLNTVFRGCRAWNNSDDGFDFTDASGACTVEYSYAFNNGINAGSGNGIRGGGFGANAGAQQLANPPRHVIRHVVSNGNTGIGFYSNEHTGGSDWINNTAFDNAISNFDMVENNSQGTPNHYLRNNVALNGSSSVVNIPAVANDAYNTWNLSLNIFPAEFVTIMGANAARSADGSLPDNGFVTPIAGSVLIDAGEPQTGMPYNGAAPDLGAVETE